ncbi:DUF2975 domain-containing protein [Clostridium sp. KNHs214]|uniref:DUF2975 domain-containing protein n=1 Tax=Clostridium sp. KNHs214 TaxID=1540257 RepID=UPI000551462D|nr:DUF2975 domain-containing protein [Clostridium sp. KNHs214]
MKYYGKESLSSFLKIIIDALLVVGIGLFIWISINTLVKDSNSIDLSKKIVIYSLFLIGAIALMTILYNLRKIMDSVIKVDPFVRQNVKSLTIISISSFIIAFCYLINFFMNIKYGNYHFIFIDKAGIHTDMEFLIFFFAGCFILVLAKVFQKAVEVKEENDLTI